MAVTRLDPIDRKILAELQADGRMTNVELAKRVGISAPPCLRRVRTLEEAGYIKGYHAEVDARELGFEVQVFAMVGLASQAETDLTAFENRCRAWPLVRSVSRSEEHTSELQSRPHISYAVFCLKKKNKKKQKKKQQT